MHPSPISARSPPPPETLLGSQPSQPIRFPSPTATVAMLEDHDVQQHHQIINPNVRPSPQQRQHDRSIFSVKHHCSLDDDEDAGGPSFHRTVTLADIADLDIVLARLAERHFREGPVHELDTLATFLALVKNSANGKCPIHTRFQLLTTKSILSEAKLVQYRVKKHNNDLIFACPVVFVDRRHGCARKKSATPYKNPTNIGHPPHQLFFLFPPLSLLSNFLSF